MTLRRALFLCGCSLFVTVAAAGPSDNDSSNVESLNYYPHQTMTAFTPKIDTTLHDYTTSSDGSNDTLYNNTLIVGVAYGFGQGFRLGLSESLLWDQNQNTIGAAGALSEDSSRGFSNPTVQPAWRFLEDDLHGFSGDIALNMMPNFGPKITADGAVSRVGNNLNGAAQLEPILTLFWRAKFNELEFQYQLTHNFAGTTEAQAASTATSAYDTQNITLRDRVHITRKFFIEGAGVYWPEYSYFSIRAVPTAPGSTSHVPSFVNPQLYIGFLADADLNISLGAIYHNGNPWAQNSRTGAITNSVNTSIMSVVSVLHQF